MKEGPRSVTSSVLTAVALSAGCLCIWWGSSVRDRLDVGSSALEASSSKKLFTDVVASRDDQTNVPASDYYSQMVSLLKQYFVEPVKDDEKLADGSVKGMVASLNDPDSLFMDQEDFRAYMNREKGLYEGIGVELALELQGNKLLDHEVRGTGKAKIRPPEIGVLPPPEDAEEAVATMSRFPTVKVVAVVPGGPADKAGVKVGDIVADVDGHWVVEDSLLDKFKKARDAFSAKKLTFAEIEPLQRELRDKTERALLPARTLPRLLVGTSGTVQITWNRNGVERSTTIAKALSQMPVADSSTTIVLPMSEAGEMTLKAALHGRDSATIDLRNDPSGSFSEMMDCLKLLAPTGRYGEIENHRSEDPTPISVESGNPNPPKLSILVGPSTRGPAAVLALALSRQGKATLVGQLELDSVPVTQDVELPDGSGYDLLIGTYRAVNPKSETAKHAPSGPGKVSDNRSLANVSKGALAQRGVLSGGATDGSDHLSGGVN